MKNKYYSLNVDEEKKEASIHIYGDITSWPWLESDVSSYTLSKEIQGLDVDTIHVRINSYGGEVAEGFAISSNLKKHKAKIVTHCDGFACSIASLIFMAGEERYMSDTSLLMIHHPWAGLYGNANELRKQADDLEKMGDISIEAFMKHVNITREDLVKMLDDETWITPAEAVEMGFATAINEDEVSDNPSQSVRKNIMQLLTKEPKETSVSIDYEMLSSMIAEKISPELEPELEPEPKEPENTIKNFFERMNK